MEASDSVVNGDLECGFRFQLAKAPLGHAVLGGRLGGSGGRLYPYPRDLASFRLG
jgi:hypothetical protein